MEHPRYALVAYVRTELGDFIQRLRKELHPDLPHLPAHLTILPPRTLGGNEPSAVATLNDICGRSERFEVLLGDVETFLPVTGTVFIRIERGAQHMRQLHDRLNVEPLAGPEEWPYMPHLTIVQLTAEAAAREAHTIARDRWAEYAGTRRVEIKELTFVREEEPHHWVDVAGVHLGRTLVNH